MVLETGTDLAESLRDLRLLEPAQLDEVLRLAEAHPALRDLARQLIDREWLTPYQANQILLGKGGDLLLGPYVLLERIGLGGMGEVFKAWHRRLHRISAIKVINKKRLQHPSAIKRFHREVESAAQLSHPNIVAVHDAGAEGETHYLVMEYIDGIDLGRLLIKTGPLPVAFACDFIAQGAIGLHHAHEMGYVHRDMKPSNLLVAPRGGLSRFKDDYTIDQLAGGMVKVLDMGLVRLQPHQLDDPELHLTHHGVVLGTMDYVAPEQARNSRNVDRRADVYSLGCTLFQLLTGRPPFNGTTAIDKILRHQTDEPPKVRETRPDVPSELDAILHRMMAKKPNHRYATAAEVAAALAAFARETPAMVPATMPAPVEEQGGVTQEEAEQVQETPYEEVIPVIMPTRRAKKARKRVREEAPPANKDWLWWVIGGVLGVGFATLLWALG